MNKIIMLFICLIFILTSCDTKTYDNAIYTSTVFNSMIVNDEGIYRITLNSLKKYSDITNQFEGLCEDPLCSHVNFCIEDPAFTMNSMIMDNNFIFFMATYFYDNQKYIDEKNMGIDTTENPLIIKKGIYRYSLKDQSLKILTEWDFVEGGHSYSLGMFQDSLYYLATDENGYNNIYKVGKDGTKNQKVTNMKSSFIGAMMIYDGTLYYIFNMDLYKTDIDNFTESLYIENVNAACIYKGDLYYFSENENKGFNCYKYNEASGEAESIITQLYAPSVTYFYDDNIFYALYEPVQKSEDPPKYNNTGGKLYKYNISSKSNKILLSNDNISYNMLYYIDNEVIYANLLSDNNDNSSWIDGKLYKILCETEEYICLEK